MRMRHASTHVHTYTLHMHVFMYEHARTSSLSAASAPSDSSFATALSHPFLIAQCSAERFRYLCIYHPRTIHLILHAHVPERLFERHPNTHIILCVSGCLSKILARTHACIHTCRTGRPPGFCVWRNPRRLILALASQMLSSQSSHQRQRQFC